MLFFIIKELKVKLKFKVICRFLFSFIDPVIAVALLVSFVIDTVHDETTKWYAFERESLITCLVEVSMNDIPKQ